MLFQLPSRSDVLVDDLGLPRFWAAVWVIYNGGNLAPATLNKKLRYLESLYVHTEGLGGDLDDALAALDFEVLSTVLESFFATLRNVPNPVNSNINRWNTAFHFVKDICERLERDPSVGNKMEDIRARMARLENLYLGLRPFKKITSTAIRAIPRSVLTELLDAVTPGSETNPFEYEGTQWRVYALVMLLLLQGLRVGEMASLPANFIRSEIDERSGKKRWYMSVRTDESEDDPRYSKPSIKTVDSIRTIPMTGLAASIVQTYLDNYRGKPNCIHFLVSMHKKPMSVEAVRHAFRKLTEALTPGARARLLNLTGAANLYPHALRHTCAVVRMQQWTAAGVSPEKAMQHMRSFFGWSKESLMPMLYAKAALDERRNETWNDELDDRVSILRNVPE